jgi:hypothetical protein
VLAARRELGPDAEDAVIAGFLGMIMALFAWVVIAGINVLYNRDRPH